jgi:hypothetical protein
LLFKKSKPKILFVSKKLLAIILSITLFRDPTVAILSMEMHMKEAAYDPEKSYRKPPVMLKNNTGSRL